MKNLLQKTFFSLVLLCSAHYGIGQSQDAVMLNAYALDESKENVEVSIKTTDSFIVGANRYVLHIGGKHFLRNLHPEGRLDEIVFIIPLEDYQAIEAEGRIVLVYGLYHENTLQDKEGNQANGFTGLHWDLGNFTPQEFTKD